MKSLLKNNSYFFSKFPSITGISKTLFFLILIYPGLMAFQPPQDKIQKAIAAIKRANDNEDQDYITDGQHIIWVKSYKRWTPEDMVILKKEGPDVLRFLSQAIQHNRFDVLDQLLPEYYRTHGGNKAFAADIMAVSYTHLTLPTKRIV